MPLNEKLTLILVAENSKAKEGIFKNNVLIKYFILCGIIKIKFKICFYIITMILHIFMINNFNE
jgi:hypothetical protein